MHDVSFLFFVFCEVSLPFTAYFPRGRLRDDLMSGYVSNSSYCLFLFFLFLFFLVGSLISIGVGIICR